ncbi:hypothetical protein CCACVL1_03512 [Corchorus capsularis]|uniref:RNase H type-1 domain-containing protein n=1 Tax=Corchorus capsularis TaxID=210143 RepID=A0A1R3JYR3_COCAP|nr:hypothetical protein CCACVL1_03512 [Corchorus capsularis]
MTIIRQQRWEIEPILQDVKLKIKSFENVKSSLVCRTANSAANWVANSARKGECPSGWVNQPPLPIVHIYNKDGIPAPPVF